MITNINEFKTNFNVDNHVLGFLFNYGKNAIHKNIITTYLKENKIYSDNNLNQLTSALIDAQKLYEKKDIVINDVDDIKKLEIEEEEPISDEYEVDKIIDVFTDMEEVKETVGSGLSFDIQPKSIERGQTIYFTALLKPRNKSVAYSMGEMGVIKCKVQQTWYGLNKLNRLKKKGMLYN